VAALSVPSEEGRPFPSSLISSSSWHHRRTGIVIYTSRGSLPYAAFRAISRPFHLSKVFSSGPPGKGSNRRGYPSKGDVMRMYQAACPVVGYEFLDMDRVVGPSVRARRWELWVMDVASVELRAPERRGSRSVRRSGSQVVRCGEPAHAPLSQWGVTHVASSAAYSTSVGDAPENMIECGGTVDSESRRIHDAAQRVSVCCGSVAGRSNSLEFEMQR